MKTKNLSGRKQHRNSLPGSLPSGLAAAALTVTAAFAPTGANALGFRIPNQDPEAIARGNAFVATADNPSAIYYNPSGITQLDGQNLQVGAQFISINSFYNSPTGNSSESRFGVQPVPEFYYTRTLTNSPISFGLGCYAPYGLSLSWPVGSSFRSDTIFQGRLDYITLNPVVAYKVNDQLSLAIGPTVNYSQVLLREGIPAAYGSQFKFRGDDFAPGFTGGVMWHPVERWSFGASYHSATSMNYGGSASTLTASSSSTAELPFAQFIIGGASFRPTTNWNFEADVDWTDWHSLKSTTFENTPLGNVPFRFDWHSSVLLEIGGTRYLPNGYFVSAGYFYSEKSTTDYDAFPTVPDTDLHVGSLGFGHKMDRWAWTVAVQIITGPDREIANNVNPAVEGRYQWVNASLNLSLRYHF